MRWRAAGLCLAGGLCAAAGAIVAALLAGAGAAAWLPGLGAVAAAAVLAVPLGFRGAEAFDRPLRAVVGTVRAWADGRMGTRIAPREGDPGDLRDLAEACNALADAVEERLRAQRRLADANAALARQSAELAALQERQRIARDLHDAVSQRLFGIHLLASAAARQVGAPPAVRELESLSREAQSEMRALLLQLRPPALAARPLRRALEDLCAEARRLGPPVWDVEIGLVGDLGPATEDGLYRIAQEAVSNVRRHAQARTATLSLRSGGDRVELSVDDDGRGFSAGGRATGGMGLPGMDERVRALGGVFRVKSQPGRGTRVEVVVPLVPDRRSDPGDPAEAAGSRPAPLSPDAADPRAPAAGADAPPMAGGGARR